MSINVEEQGIAACMRLNAKLRARISELEEFASLIADISNWNCDNSSEYHEHSDRCERDLWVGEGPNPMALATSIMQTEKEDW
jgi:hypothetical protein